MNEQSFYIDADDLEDVRVSRDMVAATSDPALLAYWFESLDERVLQIREFIDAFKLAGIADEAWLRRTGGALAYNKIGMKWVERRLLSIGVTPSYPEDDPRGQHISRLQDHIRELTAENKAMRAASADRSGEAMETRSGSTEGESAVPAEERADAPTPPASTKKGA